VNLPTENSSSTVDPVASPRFSRNALILGGVILTLVILLIVMGAKLRGMANQLDALESKSSAVLSSTQVLKESLSSEPNQVIGLTPAQLSKLLPLADQLSALVLKVPSLPMNPEPLAQNPVKPNEKPLIQKPQAPPANAEIKWWRQVRDRVWTPIRQFFQDLVKVQVVDKDDETGTIEKIALTPAAQQLVRQELRTYLLSARQLLLAGLTTQARTDLEHAQVLVKRNFAAQSKSIEQFIDQLDEIEMQLKSSSVNTSPAPVAGKK